MKRTTVIFLVLGIIILFLAGAKDLFFLATGTDTYEPDYPKATDHIFTEVKGYLKCEQKEGQWTGYDSFAMVKCIKDVCGGDFDQWWRNDEANYVYYKYVNCPEYTGDWGCQVKIDYIKCPSGSTSSFKKDSGSWTSTADYAVNSGSDSLFKMRCKTSASNMAPDWLPYAKKRVPIFAIYVYDYEGYIESGLLSGSEPRCSLISADAQQLKKMQKEDDNPLKGIDSLSPGETKPITVAWREQPAFGNVNPLGLYDNKNVLCKPFTGIWEVIKLNTAGTNDYWKQGSQLLSYGGTNTLCCGLSSNECSGDYKCEDYECVEEPVICEEGQCNIWQRGTTIEVDKEIIKDGKTYLRTITCDNDGCLHFTDKKVGCTKQSCDKMDTASEDYYCPDDHSGCLKVQVKIDCPSGQCCLEGHDTYKRQDCLSSQECCMSEAPQDPLRGACRQTCTIPNEICDNNKDDDQDGKTDNDDPDCQICVYEEEGKKISKTGIDPTACCEIYRGGTWITQESEPPKWKFWAEKTKKSYCDTTNYTLIAIIIAIAIIGGLAYYKKQGKIGRRK